MIIIKFILLAIGFMTAGVLVYGAWRFNTDGSEKAAAAAREPKAPSRRQRSVSLSSMRRLRARASSVLAGSSG